MRASFDDSAGRGTRCGCGVFFGTLAAFANCSSTARRRPSSVLMFDRGDPATPLPDIGPTFVQHRSWSENNFDRLAGRIFIHFMWPATYGERGVRPPRDFGGVVRRGVVEIFNPAAPASRRRPLSAGRESARRCWRRRQARWRSRSPLCAVRHPTMSSKVPRGVQARVLKAAARCRPIFSTRSRRPAAARSSISTATRSITKCR